MSQRRVLLLKSPKAQDPYVTAFTEAGFHVQCIPALAFNFINLEALKTHLFQVSLYSGLILTSQNAISAIENVDGYTELMKDWSERLVYSVGPATSQKAKEVLGLDSVGSDTGNAKSLSALIDADIKDSSVRPRLLYPKTDFKSGSIILCNADVREIAVYETVPDREFSSNLTSYIHQNGWPEVLIFYSPSGVEYHMDTILQLAAQAKFVAIGPSTSEALTKQGVNHVTSPKPTPAELLQTVSSV